MFRDITTARKRANAGEKDAAITLYRKIWDDRCLYPLAGQEAQGALKVLGMTVDRKSTRLNSSHTVISYAVFCLKKKKTAHDTCNTGIVRLDFSINNKPWSDLPLRQILIVSAVR